MKAVGYHEPLPIADERSLVDVDLPEPEVLALDLLVRVKAVSINPVDTKVRAKSPPKPGSVKVLGWDAVGEVVALGSAVTGFKIGDRVYYAGSIARPGTNSELHAVDERIVALAPASLDDARAAAMPLTTITAWELLFDRLGVARGGGKGGAILVTGAAGGVGSMLVQFARQLTSLTVVATASRPETSQWVRDLGAHHIIDHHRPWRPQLTSLGIAGFDLIASLTHTADHYEQIIDAAKPQGRIALIDDMPSLDAMKLKAKCLSLHWEAMFARSLFETEDMHRQGELLAETATLVDAGTIRTNFSTHGGVIDAANLRRAHAQVESGRAIGKIVCEGWA